MEEEWREDAERAQTRKGKEREGKNDRRSGKVSEITRKRGQMGRGHDGAENEERPPT